MINKKSPGTTRADHAGIPSRHQDLLELFRHSGQTPREFVTNCLKSRMLSGADAIELMGFLSTKATTRSFTLADLTDEEHFRLGFYETCKDDTENSPIFIVQFDQQLVEHSDAILVLLERFSRDLAELISEQEPTDIEPEADPNIIREEALETIMDSLPSDAVRH